ncbi:GHKL domain-containing protein [Streptococcus loxodontisalivarius]|uniref:Two-component system sensor histidine kinase AgrC n=2 Tax=Streptococcus loxodontisalivarius TaxID=1349415 RepID=A0ABS2PSE6_9STRE|nr:GHKL domain-containing protein [Streptococcus loxodontisalivarius]MBM7642848.1 two-component system sensor histidine kinase AgrC [Streptococcus loxodontisalivarius]
MLVVIIMTVAVTWFTYADASQHRLSVGPVIGLSLFEILVSFLFPYGYVLTIPLALFVYDCHRFPHRHLREHFFIAFFPPVLLDLVGRVLYLFIFPTLLPVSPSMMGATYTIQLLALLCFPISYWSLKRLFSLDYYAILDFDSHSTEKLLKLVDAIFVLYYLLVYCICIISREMASLSGITSDYFCKIFTAISFLALLYILSYLNRYSKQLIKARVKEEQAKHLKNLENHSRQIEGLYQSIRSFKHDYENILISLRGSIDSGDIELIRRVYEDILEKSMEELNQDDATIASLVHLKPSSIKSLLSSKVMEMQSKGIKVDLYFPDPIDQIFLEPLDMIILLTHLLDNAIEATLLTKNPSISISCYQKEQRQYLTIANTMLQESLDVEPLFEEHYSTYDSERGYGLYNVRKILENYPKCQLTTSSGDYHFSQYLEMGESYPAKGCLPIKER